MFRYVVAGYDDFRNGGAFETENKFNIMQIVYHYLSKKFPTTALSQCAYLRSL